MKDNKKTKAYFDQVLTYLAKVEEENNKENKSKDESIKGNKPDKKLIIKNVANIIVRKEYVDSVLKMTYYDKVTSPSYVDAEVYSIAYFLKLFTDFPIPYVDNDDRIDIELILEAVEKFALLGELFNNSLYRRLQDMCSLQIDFENQKRLAYISSASDEAIQSFGDIMSGIASLVDMLKDKLEDILDSDLGEMLSGLGEMDGIKELISSIGLSEEDYEDDDTPSNIDWDRVVAEVKARKGRD